jgi:NAD(P)-dependent dehydrogenase (short-subunit alcohol dehydrogenase family)
LAGKTALVTGGSGGIGQACAEALLRDGAAVMLMGRREEKLAESQRTLRDAVPGARVEYYAGDALDPDAVDTAVKRAHGLTGRLDIVVATVGGGGFRPIMMQDLDGLRRELDLNIGAAFLAVRHSMPYMTHGGSIVCISSTAAVMPFPWLSAYCAGKAGLEAFIRSAADELASTGVRINAVRPGMTRSEATTDMFANPDVMAGFLEQIPLNRAGEPSDIAPAVRYLAGPESSWTTGQCFAVDGGHCLRRNPDMTDLVRLAFGEDALAAVRAGKSYP